MQRWSYNLFAYHGVPVTLHASALLLLIPQIYFNHSLPVAVFGTLLLIALITVHELGHAWVCRRLGIPVLDIHVGLLHGHCAYDSAGITEYEAGLVAWGGVMAQAVVLVVALLAFLLWQGDIWPPNRHLGQRTLQYETWSVLVLINFAVMLFNLMPLPGLDGDRALPVFRPMVIAAAYRVLVGRKQQRQASRDRGDRKSYSSYQRQTPPSGNTSRRSDTVAWLNTDKASESRTESADAVSSHQAQQEVSSIIARLQRAANDD